MFRSLNKLNLVLTAIVAICGHARSQGWNFSGVNIAKGQRTEHGPGTWGSQNSGLAVDGDTEGGDDLRSCSHTLPVFNSTAYWTVFLDGLYVIKGIRIYNREGYLQWPRHKNFKVIGNPNSIIFHDDETSIEKLYDRHVIDILVYSDMEVDEITFQIPPRTAGHDGGNSIITLCEVEVYPVGNECEIPTLPEEINWTVTPGTGFVHTLDGVNQVVSSGSGINFHCRESATLKGEASIVCFPNGTFSSSIPVCIEVCQAGEYRDNDECVKCQRHTYQPQAAQSYCHNCDPGFKTVNTGSTSKDDCKPDCPAGKYRTVTVICEICPRGTWRSLAYDICQSCPVGETTRDGELAESELDCQLEVGSTASTMRFGLFIPVLATVIGTFLGFADGMAVM